MSEFKKQAIVWAITIAIAVGTIASANDASEKSSSNDTNATVLVANEEGETLLYDIYLEDGSVIYCEEDEVIIEQIVTTSNSEDATIQVYNSSASAELEVIEEESCPQIKVGKWSDYELVPGTKVPGVQADMCGLYQDNTLIKWHDETTKTIVLESGETFQYMYADISHVTSYCPCAECCDTFTGYTYSERYLPDEENPKVLAADITWYPIGTVIFVPGYGVAVVEDTGGAIDDRDLDIYIPDHEAAWNWGSVDTLVYIISYGEW